MVWHQAIFTAIFVIAITVTVIFTAGHLLVFTALGVVCHKEVFTAIFGIVIAIGVVFHAIDISDGLVIFIESGFTTTFSDVVDGCFDACCATKDGTCCT